VIRFIIVRRVRPRPVGARTAGTTVVPDQGVDPRQRDQADAGGRTQVRLVVPFSVADERFIDFLVNEAVRAWTTMNS